MKEILNCRVLTFYVTKIVIFKSFIDWIQRSLLSTQRSSLSINEWIVKKNESSNYENIQKMDACYSTFDVIHDIDDRCQ